MNFKVVNGQILFRDYDLSEHMEVKEVNINHETKEAYVVASFKASYSNTKIDGFLACMFEEMDEANLIDAKEHLIAELEKRGKNERKLKRETIRFKKTRFI